jgi:hypothetical protein
MAIMDTQSVPYRNSRWRLESEDKGHKDGLFACIPGE